MKESSAPSAFDIHYVGVRGWTLISTGYQPGIDAEFRALFQNPISGRVIADNAGTAERKFCTESGQAGEYIGWSTAHPLRLATNGG